MKIKQLFNRATIFTCMVMALTACKDFVFLDTKIDEKDNPIIQKKMPTTSADLFEPPIVTDKDLPNPDANGAFNNWATCLLMLKEGHPHGGGKMHGNFVYPNAPWKQEEFVVIHNTKGGIKVEVDTKSTITNLEKEMGKQGSHYLRMIGGGSKLWVLCFYFFDKQGKLLNDDILNNSDQYQIFFSISDVDSQGKPYDVLDVRYRADGKNSVPAEFFKNKKTFEQRRIATPQILKYTYRDTWHHDDMADGVRELFNIKLLPPFKRKDYKNAQVDDVDNVGLKGHVKFDVFGDDPIDMQEEWPVKLTNGLGYTRATGLLPQFYLAVRVMKCQKGKKAVIPFKDFNGKQRMACAPFYEPNEKSQWKELFRMNIPMKVYTNAYDSDPTHPDPNEPYYFNLGRELGISPQEAYEAAKNVVIHGSTGAGGLGYGAWFL